LTIDAVLDGTNAIVLAPTAGGKTEASMFPVLSRILAEEPPPVAALYVCPIRALLNNQEDRIGSYCRMVGLSAFKWHGDVSDARKKAFRASPSHVLMTTPESLEVMMKRVSERHSLVTGRPAISRGPSLPSSRTLVRPPSMPSSQISRRRKSKPGAPRFRSGDVLAASPTRQPPPRRITQRQTVDAAQRFWPLASVGRSGWLLNTRPVSRFGAVCGVGRFFRTGLGGSQFYGRFQIDGILPAPNHP
jgi:hypothetical protein